ncbi:MAG: replicative DNA helicase [Nitrospinota bacterium]|nr:replicative DNA helicase [Nitrospinota bacterium]
MVRELNARVNTLPGRVPPQNLGAEQSVLGGILFDNSSLPKALESLKTGEEFYFPAHKLIYAAFIELFEKSEPIDLMTVSEALRKKKQIDESGGLDYLAELLEMIQTAANVGIHSRIVKEKALLRQLISTAGDLVNLGFEDTDDVDNIIDRAEQMIFKLAEERIQRGFIDMKQLVSTASEHIEALDRNKELITGLSTGFKRIDEKTAGFQKGDLIIVAGRPSMGKTALCINIAENVGVFNQQAVAFFSLEMSSMQLALRMISSLSHVPLHKIRTGFAAKNDWANLHKACGQLFDSNIHIDDTPMQSVLDIRAKARRLKAEKGLDLIVIDYLQLLHSNTRSENRVLEIGEMTRSLKGLARELEVPIILISQLSRKVEDRPNKKPQLADLRESGAIEQDADIVGFVYRESYYDRDNFDIQGKASFIIGKQRNGPTGEIELAWNGECTRFDNLSYETPDESNFIEG